MKTSIKLHISVYPELKSIVTKGFDFYHTITSKETIK